MTGIEPITRSALYVRRGPTWERAVRPPRADLVADPADDQAREDRHRDRRDDDVADLRLGEVELVAHHRHQRRDPEPGEEAEEERHPGGVERPHLWRPEREQRYPCRATVR
jgi:hypothetical protein